MKHKTIAGGDGCAKWDTQNFEQRENTLTLLKMLALGQREMDHGALRDAEVVLPKSINLMRHESGHFGLCAN